MAERQVRHTVVRTKLDQDPRVYRLHYPMSERHVAVPSTWMIRTARAPEECVKSRSCKCLNRAVLLQWHESLCGQILRCTPVQIVEALHQGYASLVGHGIEYSKELIDTIILRTKTVYAALIAPFFVAGQVDIDLIKYSAQATLLYSKEVCDSHDSARGAKDRVVQTRSIFSNNYTCRREHIYLFLMAIVLRTY